MDCAAARCYNKSREFSVRICNLGKGGGFMETRVLKYFLAVAREENITKAAEQLHITQPTLSRQLAQLEEELGVHLFERGTRRTTLTSEGLLLRRRAEEIVELMDKTERELAEQEELVDGTVSIGWGELESVKFVASMLRAFSEKYPLVRYRLYSANADHLKSQIDRDCSTPAFCSSPRTFPNMSSCASASQSAGPPSRFPTTRSRLSNPCARTTFAGGG